MSIADTFVAEVVPLRVDNDGVVRVGQTRVRLETVVIAFNAGCDPKQILEKYPSLKAGEIYAVIAHYLRHQSEVDAYVAECRRVSAAVGQELDDHFPRNGVRERLLARRKSSEPSS